MTGFDAAIRWLQGDAAGLWLWTATTGFTLAFALTLAVAAIDRRQIGRESIWAKPLKFELSLAIHYLTLAWLSQALSDAYRTSDLWSLTATTAVAAGVFEIVYIIWRAARKERSHFNMSTPVAAAFYVLMAVGAVIITLAAAVLAVLMGLDQGYDGGAGLRMGAMLGLGGGAVLTLLTAFPLGGAMSHHVGIEPDGAQRMPITGWSMTVGDRRPAHFLATHMMQVLPVCGLLADTVLPAKLSQAAVVAATVLYVGLTWAAFRRASLGKPLLNWRRGGNPA